MLSPDAWSPEVARVFASLLRTLKDKLEPCLEASPVTVNDPNIEAVEHVDTALPPDPSHGLPPVSFLSLSLFSATTFACALAIFVSVEVTVTRDNPHDYLPFILAGSCVLVSIVVSPILRFLFVHNGVHISDIYATSAKVIAVKQLRGTTMVLVFFCIGQIMAASPTAPWCLRSQYLCLEYCQATLPRGYIASCLLGMLMTCLQPLMSSWRRLASFLTQIMWPTSLNSSFIVKCRCDVL